MKAQDPGSSPLHEASELGIIDEGVAVALQLLGQVVAVLLPVAGRKKLRPPRCWD